MTDLNAHPLWSEVRQQQLAQHVSGFWAQAVWLAKEIPVPHNDPSKHRRKNLLSFATHCAAVNTELQYVYQQCFQQQHWVPWCPNVHELRLLTRFVNAQCSVSQATLWVASQSAFEIKLRTWLIAHNPKGFTRPRFHPVLGLWRRVYTTLAQFYDPRDEWDKDLIDLGRLGFQTPPGCHNGITINLTRIYQPWLREIVRTYLKGRVDLAAGTLRNHLNSLVILSKFLQGYPDITGPAQVSQALMQQFLSTPASHRHWGNPLQRLQQFFGHCRIKEHADFPPQLIKAEQIPKAKRPQADYIPDTVVTQLLAKRSVLAEPFQTMLCVQLEIGARTNELCQLAIDCLSQDQDGDYYVTRVTTKQPRSLTVPISLDTATVIQAAQQQAKACYGESVKHLFPKNARQPFLGQTFNRVINRYIEAQHITDDSGRLWHFTAKQCRHTVATRLINQGVSQPTVQRFLGHQTAQMTDVYAHVHNQTLKEAFFKYQGQTGSSPDPTAEPKDETVLTNGFCGHPPASGDCASRSACLNCTHFKTFGNHN